MQNFGQLFVFEGPDSVGKTTLATAFVKRLRETGIECDHYSFPGHDPKTLGKLVYDLHHNSAAYVSMITPASMQLLHVAAHIDAIETNIIPALKNGKHVVLDRFWWSTWVYGIVSGADRETLKAMLKLEFLYWKKIRPAVAFFIRRGFPVGGVVTSSWLQLLDEYDRLATVESTKYPVLYVQNDGALVESMADIIKQLIKTNTMPLTRISVEDKTRKHQTELPFPKNKSANLSPVVFSSLAPAKPTIVYDTYWRFAMERQTIFFKKVNGERPPWTKDAVLREHKFTNPYRAADRVSQYLIRNVIYKGDQSADEVFFRVLMFKFFNKIETWELLESKVGIISFADYSFGRYDSVLTAAMDAGDRVYSAAYIMPSGGRLSQAGKKHRMHLKLLEQMMQEQLPSRIAEAKTMRKAFELLRSYPTIGDFLAYQYVTDLNYSSLTNFDEMEFVAPGPGALSGIRKCFSDFGGLNEAEIIKVVTDRQEREFDRLELKFQTLWGRRLQLIDCQNLFCEVDKYARIMHPEFSGTTGRTRIKQKYRVTNETIQYWFPPKWGLNEKVNTGGANAKSI